MKEISYIEPVLGTEEEKIPATPTVIEFETIELTTEESERLEQLEEAIEATVETGYAAIAKALKEIRDERLYRKKYSSFAAYVSERWGYSRSHAYRLINWANVVEVSPAGDTPKTERASRTAKAELKIEAKAKPDASPSAVLKTGQTVIPEKEFKAFGKFVDRLVNGLAPFAYRPLLTQMREHIDAVIAAKEAELELEFRACKPNDKKEVAA